MKNIQLSNDIIFDFHLEFYQHGLFEQTFPILKDEVRTTITTKMGFRETFPPIIRDYNFDKNRLLRK